VNTSLTKQNRTDCAKDVRHVEESKEVERIKKRWRDGTSD
jgi:hypothetical protein